MTVVDSAPDPLASIPGGSSSAPRKSAKKLESSQSEDNIPNKPKPSKNEVDITKIRAQHEKEKSAQR